MKRFAIFLLGICFNALGATYVVSSNADAGANTLRDAITQANANGGADVINFNLGGPAVITLASCLPDITGPTTINGFSDPANAVSNALGMPSFTINANGTCINVLFLSGAGSSGSTIQGLNIYGGNRGIYMNGNSNGNFIYGNFIGTNLAGTAVAPNVIVWNGMELDQSSNNTIGGLTLTQRNVISGANEMGIRLQGASTGNIIRGNGIGVNVTGTGAVPNAQRGIFFLGGSNTNTVTNNLISGNGQTAIFSDNCTGISVLTNVIGTNVSGTAAVANGQMGVQLLGATNSIVTGNLISGNGQMGLYALNSTGLTISGNQVGTDAAGTAAIPNSQIGMRFETCGNSSITGNTVSGNNETGIFILNCPNISVQNNRVGTNLTGTAAVANLQAGVRIENTSNHILRNNTISGNGQVGAFIYNSPTTTSISGNMVGTNSAGTAAIPNAQNGIAIYLSAGVTIENNVLSGNTERGLYVETCTSMIVQNNMIGTTITGNAALANNTRGMEVVANSHDMQILNNVISSNAQFGAYIGNSERPICKGNKIGVGADGTTVLGNLQAGIQFSNCLSPVVGGSGVGEGNYISNNSWVGLTFNDCSALVMKGNRIGLDGTGTVDRGNGQNGVTIVNCINPVIGGALAGEGNYVSGNNAHGISISGATSIQATIKGNVIGLGTDLSTALGNGAFGIELTDCENSQVGGITANDRNYLSDNASNGISIVRSGNTVVEGNYVGVDGTGLLPRGNRAIGIQVVDSDNVMIGGTAIVSRNIVCDNYSNGIVLDGTSANCRVKANFVGIGKDGSTSMGNGFTGIYLLGTITGAIIGGSTFAERNVSSGNGGRTGTGDGIRIEGPDGVIVLGNYCGTDSTGTLARPNYWGGISMNESDNNTIGGTGTFEGNICASNLNEGLYLRNANNNVIIGNYIGTDKTGTLQLGNEDWGINISPAGPNTNNRIGGSLAERNIIAYNKNVPGYVDGGPGVYINTNSHRNTITFNAIYCNQQKGIERNGAGNENIATPVIVVSDANTVSGTAPANATIHVYRNTTATDPVWCDCEGEIYVGTTTADGAGNYSLTHSLGLSAADAAKVTTTATNATGSTSAFADCITALPVTYLSFTVSKLNSSTAILNWATGSEMNNDYFVVLRSTDGVNFVEIATVNGIGNSMEVTNYSYSDFNVPDAAVVYYRLQQVDIDGKFSNSPIRSIAGSGQTFVVHLEGNALHVGVLMMGTKASIRVMTSTGQVVYEGAVEGEGWVEADFSIPGLSKGAYIIQMLQSSEVAAVKAVN